MKKINNIKTLQITNDVGINIWMTPLDPEFNSDMFLYHYTNFETACKILYGESLKFSSLSRTNDTVESKPKIKAKNKKDQVELTELLEYFKSINKNSIQLMCFSKDLIVDNKNTTHLNIYDDFTGRGFALPRMWAQYGENNEGVCLIINKKGLINLIENTPKYRRQIIRYGDVDYKSIFDSYTMTFEEIKDLKDYFSNSNAILNYQFLSENKKFIERNYFTKSLDWQQENEYRLLAYNETPIYVENLREYLVGIVVGETMAKVNKKIIYELSKEICDQIKQIQFNYSECTLKNLDFKGFDIYA